MLNRWAGAGAQRESWWGVRGPWLRLVGLLGGAEGKVRGFLLLPARDRFLE